MFSGDQPCAYELLVSNVSESPSPEVDVLSAATTCCAYTHRVPRDCPDGRGFKPYMIRAKPVCLSNSHLLKREVIPPIIYL
jgi:hypothetical protein